MPGTTSNGGLIRIHPKDGGTKIVFNKHLFLGVSPDIFLTIDRADNTQAYQITRKLNLCIQINPKAFPAEDFFRYVTRGSSKEDPFAMSLKKTSKCGIHGDSDTGLCAHPELLKRLKLHLKNLPGEESIGFEVDGARYVFDSVGVAANHDYGAVGRRQNNLFINHSSHFEIKFCRQGRIPPYETICLNIHLQGSENNFGKKEVLNRLEASIRLFYRELGVLVDDTSEPETLLRTALKVDHMNHEPKGFSIDHPTSLAISQKAIDAKKYIKRKDDPRGYRLLDCLSQGFHKSAEATAISTEKETETELVFPPNLKDESTFPPLTRGL